MGIPVGVQGHPELRRRLQEPSEPLGALIVHVNDAHRWTRERIAAWGADPDVPQDPSHADH